jgi:glycosyltransferase involved in cell wall biosynthesis
MSGTALFKRIESSFRRVQSEAQLPYLALFDSYRMAEAGRRQLRGYDLIHERFNLLAMGGAWASRKLGIPFVLEVNADLLEQRKFKGVPEKGVRRLYAEWATRSCFNSAARIICISEDLKKHLSGRWKIEASKLAVLPCAADVDAFRPDQSGEATRHELGLTNESVVIWVGGFFPWHDLDLLVESFRQVVQKRANVRLLLVGDGPTRPAIEGKLAKNGLCQAVIMTGAIAHSRVPEMVAAADIAVVPASPVSASGGGTGTPLKLFEYMAAGKAIVATALNQATDVICDGYNGRLVEAGDATGFAQALLALLDDSMERRRLGQNARQRAVERYSWQAYTRRLEEIYGDVLGNGRISSSAF